MLLFAASILLLFLANIVKIERQSQFIEIYEKPPKAALSQALSITLLLNLVLPFKLGNIFRVFYPKKHLENGATFCLSTVAIDILLDFFTITVLYATIFFLGKNVQKSLLFYLIVCGVIVLGLLLAFLFKKLIKKSVMTVAMLFNESICLKMLKTTWFLITSFKNMFLKINKWKLLLYTVLSNGLYLASYYCFSRFLIGIGVQLGFLDIFTLMYGSANLKNPMFHTLFGHVPKSGALYLFVYLLVTIAIVFLFSYVCEHMLPKKGKGNYISILPPIHPHDRLVFLTEYFSDQKGSYIRNYLELNQDVAIIEDYSAGSNAKTMLCSKDDKTFYRKVSFGKDAEKLYAQIEWLENHKDALTLTETSHHYMKDGVCAYDMPYINGAVSCFNYVHTMPFADSWGNIKAALDDIDQNLHTLNQRRSDVATVNLYIEDKVFANLERIKEAKHIKPLLKYEYIYINGKKYHNLPYFEKYLTKEHLYQIFKNDRYSDIHGDFTIENIICLKEKTAEQKSYYIIDPNTGNLHDSPYLDYAKLLQSIHGGYEFLMKTESVTHYNEKIDFLFTKSNIYYKLFKEYRKYLEEKFGSEGVKSIFYHELIHWLRLMPYKTNKIGERCLIFYAGLIMVATDIEEWFEKDENSNI